MTLDLNKGHLMYIQQLFILATLISYMLSGCSTSDATNDSADNNFTILEGTVPGTLIEAFCLDGSYYKVNSIQNNSSEHPFSLSIPKNLNCHLVMSTNEDNLSTKVVTPIRIDTADGNSSLFYGVSDRANLSYVPLALDRQEIIDSTGDGVSDEPLSVQVYNGALVAVISADDPMDSDHDGIINIYEDDDEDGIYNDQDDDNIHENDSDGDGIEDDDDIDDDNNGINDDDEDDESHNDEIKENSDDSDDDDDKEESDD